MKKKSLLCIQNAMAAETHCEIDIQTNSTCLISRGGNRIPASASMHQTHTYVRGGDAWYL